MKGAIRNMSRRCIRACRAWFSAAIALAIISTEAVGMDFGPLRLTGYFKNFSVIYDMPDTDFSLLTAYPATAGSVTNRLRLDGSMPLGNTVRLEASYSIAPRVQDKALFDNDPLLSSGDPPAYRVDDMNARLYPDKISSISSFAVYQNLDRAFVSVALPAADIFVGRQAIAWGAARSVNPTDVIAPYAYTDLDTEDRIGVDAIRVRVPLGLLGEIDAGYVAGKDFAFDRSAFFLRGTLNTAGTDLSAMLVGFRENLMIGLDLTRAIGGAGFWVEGAYVVVDGMSDNGDGVGDDYLRLTTGLDYSFGSRTYGFVEYHYNQAGSNDAGDYAANRATTAYREGAVYLLGEHYVIPGLVYQFTPLVTGTAQAWINAGDPSVSVVPNIEYNIAENIYLSGGAYIGVGKSSEVLRGPFGIPTGINFRSEFGAYPDFYYGSFRVYF